MRILVTGSDGFVGKNLVCELRSKGYEDLYLYDLDTRLSVPGRIVTFSIKTGFFKLLKA
jgi:nucleoside-diphosphate-sugar epimerase